MNSKESQKALEIMLMKSLSNRLHSLGADLTKAAQTVNQLDFDDIRAHYGRTDEDLKAQFANLFR